MSSRPGCRRGDAASWDACRKTIPENKKRGKRERRKFLTGAGNGQTGIRVLPGGAVPVSFLLSRSSVQLTPVFVDIFQKRCDIIASELHARIGIISLVIVGAAAITFLLERRRDSQLDPPS